MDEALRTAPKTHDASVLAELGDVFGPQRLDALLKDLGNEIARRFEPPSDDRALLAQDAHATVSISGALGFEALSQACSALEAACNGMGNVAVARDRAVAAAHEALAMIGMLRAQPS